MDFLYIVVIILVFIVPPLVFIIIHLDPLTEEEVKSLGNKRRDHQIRIYFSFDNREFKASSEFKKNMQADGSFYQIQENIFEFPSLAAALLKYKKHEWIIVAFERDKKVNLIWVNKGFNRTSVSLHLPIGQVAKIATEKMQNSIFIFHNHPNINPNYYDCRKPSEKDINSAKEFSSVLNNRGFNLLEFICERGRHYEYFLSPSDKFLPFQEFVLAINNVNGQTKARNLLLHLERIF